MLLEAQLALQGPGSLQAAQRTRAELSEQLQGLRGRAPCGLGSSSHSSGMAWPRPLPVQELLRVVAAAERYGAGLQGRIAIAMALADSSRVGQPEEVALLDPSLEHDLAAGVQRALLAHHGGSEEVQEAADDAAKQRHAIAAAQLFAWALSPQRCGLGGTPLGRQGPLLRAAAEAATAVALEPSAGVEVIAAWVSALSHAHAHVQGSGAAHGQPEWCDAVAGVAKAQGLLAERLCGLLHAEVVLLGGGAQGGASGWDDDEEDGDLAGGGPGALP